MRRIVLVFTVAGIVGCFSSMVLAQGNVVPLDGTWMGTTSDGEDFSLEVRSDGTEM